MKIIPLLLATYLIFIGTAKAQLETIQTTLNQLQVNADLNLVSDNAYDDGIVLMLHGTLAHKDMEIVETMQYLLGDYGINSLAINLSFGIDNRPQAMFECDSEHRHRHENALNEIGFWVDWLNAQGAQSIHLWGHSRGGNQVIWYARENPHHIAKVIAVAPMTGDYQNNRPAPDLLAKASEAMASMSTKLMAVERFLHCQNTLVSPATMMSYYGSNPNFVSVNHLKAMNTPVLVIAGSEDTVVPKLPMQMQELMQQPSAQQLHRYEYIEGADHFFRDLYADEAVEFVVEWLEE